MKKRKIQFQQRRPSWFIMDQILIIIINWNFWISILHHLNNSYKGWVQKNWENIVLDHTLLTFPLLIRVILWRLYVNKSKLQFFLQIMTITHYIKSLKFLLKSFKKYISLGQQSSPHPPFNMFWTLP